MHKTLYSTLYTLLEKGDVERRTIFPDKVALYQDGEEKYKEGDGDWENADLTENIKPEPHLVIFGAGHVSKAIAEIAHVLQMKVTVIDEREEVLNRDRFNHGEELILESYTSFLAKKSPFFRPYYIIVTHGHAYDRACLEWCLRSNYAYLGMIGSKGKVATTFSLLKEKGITEEDLKNVHAPIGLSIGAVTPEEIAISILSEVISIFRSSKNTITLDPSYLEKAKLDQGISARIVEKRGSAPRAVGSEIFISSSGEVFGTVGGGRVEKETIEEARRMKNSGEKSKLIHYNLSAKGDLNMICGGDVSMLFSSVEG